MACSPAGPSAWRTSGPRSMTIRVSSTNWHTPGISAAPVRRASSAGPAGIRDGMTDASRPPRRPGTGPGRRSGRRSGPGAGRRPTGSSRPARCDRSAPSPALSGRRGSRRTRPDEHLDHGGDREAAQAGPGAGQVPVAAVRQHHDRPRLGLSTAQPGRLAAPAPGRRSRRGASAAAPAPRSASAGSDRRAAAHQPVVGRAAGGQGQVVTQVGQWRPWVRGRRRAAPRAIGPRSSPAPDSAPAWSSRPGRRRGRPGPATAHRPRRRCLGLPVDRAGCAADGDQSGHRQERHGDLQHVRDAEARPAALRPG